MLVSKTLEIEEREVRILAKDILYKPAYLHLLLNLSREPKNAKELTEHVQILLPSRRLEVSPTTMYRILRRFKEIGLVKEEKLALVDKRRRYYRN